METAVPVHVTRMHTTAVGILDTHASTQKPFVWTTTTSPRLSRAAVFHHTLQMAFATPTTTTNSVVCIGDEFLGHDYSAAG